MLGNLIGKGGLIRIPTKTIKVTVRTWDSLKSLKKENETFDDVIKGLLNERTKSIGNENVKAIKYKRKTGFLNITISNKEVGFEFEYNDVKDNKSDFVLDLKIKKVFFGRRAVALSEFFGVDNAHKHYSDFLLIYYLSLARSVLFSEFKVDFNDKEKEGNSRWTDLVFWKQLYYNYNLSEESFKADIEEPLRLSEDDKPSEEWKERIKNSILVKLLSEEKKE